MSVGQSSSTRNTMLMRDTHRLEREGDWCREDSLETRQAVRQHQERVEQRGCSKRKAGIRDENNMTDGLGRLTSSGDVNRVSLGQCSDERAHIERQLVRNIARALSSLGVGNLLLPEEGFLLVLPLVPHEEAEREEVAKPGRRRRVARLSKVRRVAGSKSSDRTASSSNGRQGSRDIPRKV